MKHYTGKIFKNNKTGDSCVISHSYMIRAGVFYTLTFENESFISVMEYELERDFTVQKSVLGLISEYRDRINELEKDVSNILEPKYESVESVFPQEETKPRINELVTFPRQPHVPTPIKETTNEELFRKDLEGIGLLDVIVKEDSSYMLNIKFRIIDIEVKTRCRDEYVVKNNILIGLKRALE